MYLEFSSSSSFLMGMAPEPIHILAVDDNPVERMCIERLFKHSSYKVTVVESGSKALEFLGWREGGDESGGLKMSPPSVSSGSDDETKLPVAVNLVITDYCMPGMTGYDLLKKIKESSSLRDLPVFIMSSDDVPARINRCKEEGAEDFFLKPVNLSDLQKINSFMTKSKFGKEIQAKETSLDVSAELVSTLTLAEELTPTPPPPPPSPLPTPLAIGNKRKVLEKALSPERTRPRCSGIATVV